MLPFERGQEQRELFVSQFKRYYHPIDVYNENASKTRKGGLLQMRLEHNLVTIVENPAVATWANWETFVLL